MKYCPYCGSEVDDGYSFCTSCGGKLVEKNQPTQENNSDDNLFGFEEGNSNYNQTSDQQPQQPQAQQEVQPQEQKLNTCCFLGFIFAFVFAFVGLILSCMGLSQVKNNPTEKGKGFAIAGVVLSILSMVGSFIISYAIMLANM